MRFLTILHLCLVFTAISWYAGYPFMGEWLEIKTRKILLESVMGKNHADNAGRFKDLPMETQTKISQEYQKLHERESLPWSTKAARAVNLLFWEISPFEQAWILFSIILPVFVLLQIEGIGHAIWLLPLITCCYAIENQWTGVAIKPVNQLIPSEEYLVKNFMKEPLGSGISTQHTQLTHAWNDYLIVDWAKESPSANEAVYQQQMEKGEFAFHLAQLREKPKESNMSNGQFHQKTSPWILAMYLLWNLFFAWKVQKNGYLGFQPKYSIDR